MAARILDLRDAALEYLASRGADSEAAYVVSDKTIQMGRMLVRVFPAAYGDDERLAKGRVNKGMKLVVTAEEKYTEAASNDANGPVPTDWLDERVTWVEENLFNPLNTKGEREQDLLGDRFRVMTCEITTVYDPDRLSESKLFWSMLELSYQEQGVTQ